MNAVQKFNKAFYMLPIYKYNSEEDNSKINMLSS